MATTFTTTFIDNKIPDDPRMEELKYWCQIFQKFNLTPLYKERSLGNLSFRMKDGEDSFIITAAALALKDNLTNDSFVTVHFYDGEKELLMVSGTKEPSTESVLHFSIYNARKDVRAVFHGHSGKIIHSSNALQVATTKRFEEYGSLELVRSALDVLGDRLFLVLKNHGFLALGASMEEAGTRAMTIYEQARALTLKKQHQKTRKTGQADK